MCHVKITQLYKFLDWASGPKAADIQMLSNKKKLRSSIHVHNVLQ